MKTLIKYSFLLLLSFLFFGKTGAAATGVLLLAYRIYRLTPTGTRRRLASLNWKIETLEGTLEDYQQRALDDRLALRRQDAIADGLAAQASEVIGAKLTKDTKELARRQKILDDFQDATRKQKEMYLSYEQDIAAAEEDARQTERRLEKLRAERARLRDRLARWSVAHG